MSIPPDPTAEPPADQTESDWCLYDWVVNIINKLKATWIGRLLFVLFVVPFCFCISLFIWLFFAILESIYFPIISLFEYIKYGESKTWKERAARRNLFIFYFYLIGWTMLFKR